jgi:uncharacterized protein involved in exopolysaccharide biosynthesis
LGLYLGIHDDKLRYFTVDGQLVPTPDEAEQLQRQRADIQQQRAEQLAEYLRSQGIDPDNLPQ